MKCVFVLLSLVALGCAVPLFQEERIRILVADDDTVTIYGHSDKGLVITRVLGHHGPKNVEIFTADKYGSVRRILLDQDSSMELPHTQYWTGLTEADILVGIFKNYQGYVDMNTYTHLLRQVYTYSQSGHVSMAVYDVLKCVIVRDLSWNTCVRLDTDMLSNVSPKWYSLFNRLGLKGTESEYTGTTHYNTEAVHPYGLDYVTGEPRNVLGQHEYLGQHEHLGQIIPQQYHESDLDAHSEKMVEPTHYQSTHYQQGYLWQQPYYQRTQQMMKSYPYQLNHYYNYVNAPLVY